MEARAHNRKLRLIALGKIGDHCECCGEARIQFLAIDHRFGGGKKHREQEKSTQFYRRIRDGEVDLSLFRILCHNCNQSRGYYSVCPHEAEHVLCA